jgi:hypothetical protein
MKPGMDYPQLSRTYWDRAYLSSFEKVNGIAEDLTWEIFRDTLIEQGRFLHYSCRRVVALYSFNRRTRHRNCSWRIHHGKVVFVSSKKTSYHFEDICEILNNTMLLFSETAYVQDRLPTLMTQLNLQN